MKLLVTGGAGYIGSHTCLVLMEAGHEVTILDNFSNSSLRVIDRISALAGQRPAVVDADIRDRQALSQLFARQRVDAVIHFAGLKAVGESVSKPLEYYDNNVAGTLCLLQAMQAAGVSTLVFSSSATVYGDPASVPIREDFPLSATNPYGASKLHIEDMLRALHQAEPHWRIAILRYFNPAGAHSSGQLGEDPSGIPNNLMPYIAQVAIGRLDKVKVFGDDYPTPDGTGVRDYIHVMDLAEGHQAALAALNKPGLITCNLGTGTGYSVLDMIQAFSAASEKAIPYDIVARRPGDIAQCYTDPAQAQRQLGWQARKGLPEICADHWRWQQQNPQGYQ